MSVEKFTKKDTLINLYNQILQDLTVAETQVQYFQRLSLINVSPEVTKELAQWQIRLEETQSRLTVVAELIDKETKSTTERIIN